MEGQGAAYLLIADPQWFESGTAPLEQDIAIVAASDGNAVIWGEDDGDEMGSTVLATPLDGDDYADVVIGAPGVDGSAGAVYIVRGADDYRCDLRDQVTTEWYGEGTQEAGKMLAGAGDQDGDGIGDLLIGAPSGNRCYLVSGEYSGALALSDAPACLLGAGSDEAGSAANGAGDLDGDGYSDILIGAARAMDGVHATGAVYLILDRIAGDYDLANAAGVFYGEAVDDEAGASVDAGDLDLDGACDLLVGAPYNDANDADAAGSAYLIYGPLPTGTVKLTVADAHFLGQGTYTQAGHRVQIAGHLEGSAYPDIVISMPGYDIQRDLGSSVFLFFGERQ